MTSFFYCGRLSSAQLDRWQAPQQRPIIDPQPVEQTSYWRDIKNNGYKSVFTNSWLVRQRNKSWIKGLGKNPQKSELIYWRQCLLSGAFCPLGLRETLACIHVILHNVTATCSVLTRLPAKLAKNRMRVKMFADRWLKISFGVLNGIRCKLVKLLEVLFLFTLILLWGKHAHLFLVLTTDFDYSDVWKRISETI